MFTSAHLLGMTLAVQNPDELIAVIPHLLGFDPEESIVFLPMRSDLPVARVDLPTTARDRDFVWNSIRDAFSRYAQPGTSVGIVCITADRAMAEEIGPEFAARLDSIGIDTRLVVWPTKPGGQTSTPATWVSRPRQPANASPPPPS